MNPTTHHTMQLNTELNDRQREAVAKILNALFAGQYVLSTKPHNDHRPIPII
ncbi:MAG: hypothetical protein IH623_10605 [Verrucomicrobia bacterium]|nr:hypothetical protein [Verrucomicrobiota bacterium]